MAKLTRKCPSGCGKMAVEKLCFLDEGDNCILCGYSFTKGHYEWRTHTCKGDRKTFLDKLGLTEEKAFKKVDVR